MTRLLLVAAALVALLAAAGLGRVGLCRCPRKKVAGVSESDAYDATK
jgi:predicted thioredoxin/glutaredoxin